MAFSEPDKNTPKGAVEWRWFERADKLPFLLRRYLAAVDRIPADLLVRYTFVSMR